MEIKFPARVELKIGTELGRFQLDFSVCENPDCDCNGVNMILYNENKEIQFFLDFKTESYGEKNYSEEENRILNKFIEFLKSEENSSLNIGFFRRNYKYVKERVKNRRDAINSFELGTFMAYRDIFWKADNLELSRDGKNYYIFDGYCVHPNCECIEVALSFFEDIYKLGIRTPDFSFIYSYNNGRYRDPIGVTNIQVKNIINVISEKLNKRFKKRHIHLKKEVKKDIERKIKEIGFTPKKSARRKLGRNELCHCGSGKKYKKCCLNEDIERLGSAIKVS